jgi:hypothetical protein
VQPKHDPFIDMAEQAMYALARTLSSGSYLVDQIPVLKHLPDWFPGAGFKAQAKEWSKPMTLMPVLTFDFVKDAMVNTSASYRPCRGVPEPFFDHSFLVNYRQKETLCPL